MDSYSNVNPKTSSHACESKLDFQKNPRANTDCASKQFLQLHKAKPKFTQDLVDFKITSDQIFDDNQNESTAPRIVP